MSTAQPHRNGSTDIIGSLREKLNATVLPITPAQRERLLLQLGSDMLSLNELTQEIMSVPVAALHVCRAAGDAARNKDVDILTLEQACGLLGTQRLGTQSVSAVAEYQRTRCQPGAGAVLAPHSPSVA